MNKPILEIDEVLNEAIMTGSPSIIVEGIDDVSIYSGILQQLPFRVEIYAIETIKDFNEGCEQVIKAINTISELDIGAEKIYKNVLGIIDKDVRDFREEVPQHKPILMLKFYSIESHFYSKNLVKITLEKFSKVDKSKLSDNLISLLMRDIEEKVLDIYYFSLEALRKSLEKNYQSDFGYAEATGRMKDEQLRAKISAKADSLDGFAKQHGLERNIDTLMLIAKGKWLLESFCDEIISIVREMPNMCSTQKIETCRSCLTEEYNKCMYRLRDGTTKRTIESFALSITENESLDYIRDRVSHMKSDRVSIQ